MRAGKLGRCRGQEDAHEGAESVAALNSVDERCCLVYPGREPNNDGASSRRKAPVGFEMDCSSHGARPRHAAPSPSRTAAAKDVHAAIAAHDRHDTAWNRLAKNGNQLARDILHGGEIKIEDESDNKAIDASAKTRCTFLPPPSPFRAMVPCLTTNIHAIWLNQ